MSDLSVALAGLPLKNPIMTASGTSGHSDELAPFFALGELGAFVTKGVSPYAKVGNPPPRICETPSGMLNAIGLENPGIPAFLNTCLPKIPWKEVPVIVNCFGRDEETYREAVALLEAAPGVAAIELNVSCPNVKQGGIAFGATESSIAALVRACIKETRKPLFVKLSPIYAETLRHAEAALNAGATGLTCFNTLIGTDIDIRTRRFRLSPGRGGLSGPAVLPVSLYKVHEICTHLPGVPVIAAGGVTSGADALKYILAGATAVQVGTALLTEPSAPIRIIRELDALLSDQGVSSVADIRGAVTPNTQ